MSTPRTSGRHGWRRAVPVAGAGIMGLLFGATAFLRYEQSSLVAQVPLLAD